MGYYSVVTYEVDVTKVNQDKLNEVNKILNSVDAPAGFEEIELHWNGKELYIGLDQHEEGKFYDTQDYAKLLSAIIEEGYIKLFFKGEDGNSWGYHIENNTITELSPVFVPSYLVEEIEKFVDSDLSPEHIPEVISFEHITKKELERIIGKILTNKGFNEMRKEILESNISPKDPDFEERVKDIFKVLNTVEAI